MNPRVVVPILVIAIAAYFGWQQHQSCAIVLPGVSVPSQCQTPAPQPHAAGHTTASRCDATATATHTARHAATPR
ncbi:MAG: hypothetical protein HC933_08700, partial [Pleurocapsa sp. SU_196_0]|nr:hypothetical protein [Pleurocapsa sp. SU_196_0]